MKKVDPLKLSSDLIKIKSVTPDAGEAIDLIITTVSYTHLRAHET